MNGNYKWMMLGALILGLSVAGCVEEEASVVMHTNIVGEGTVEQSGGDGGGTVEETASCEFPLEFEEPSVWTKGSINMAELEDPGQQLVAGSDAGATRYRYTFRTIMENRLSDSREVGSSSGGGGGNEGYENLELNKNDVLITSAEVTLSSEDANFEVVFERRGTMLVQSAGGVASYGVPLIDGPDEWQAVNDAVSAVGPDVPVEFVAEIQLHGRRLSGDSVESNLVTYPLSICADCQMSTNPQCQVSN